MRVKHRLWYSDMPFSENVGIWWYRIKWLARAATYPPTGGMGCACGWQCRNDKRSFRPNYWWGLWWDEHVENDCPLSRDEHGNVITYS